MNNALRGKAEAVRDHRSSAGRFAGGRGPREQVVREMLRERRDDAEDAQLPATAGDAAKAVLVERAKQWVHQAPGGSLPGRTA